MKTFAVVNQKGGSGKTTAAVNLAGCLSMMGKRVLVIDLDVQKSATNWLGCEDGGQGILDIFTTERALKEFVVKTNFERLEVIPSTQYYIGIERVLSSITGAEFVLREKIEKLPAEWDYVFIDCPPSLSLLTVSALVAAQWLFVPVEPHYMAMKGLAQLESTLEAVKKRFNPGLEIFGIMPSRVNLRTNNARSLIENLRKRFGGKVFETSIRENVTIAEAPSWSKPVLMYDPKSHGAEDSLAASKEFLSRMEETKNA